MHSEPSRTPFVSGDALEHSIRASRRDDLLAEVEGYIFAENSNHAVMIYGVPGSERVHLLVFNEGAVKLIALERESTQEVCDGDRFIKVRQREEMRHYMPTNSWLDTGQRMDKSI